MPRGAPPVPAPISNRLDASDSPSGLARRNASSRPPGNRKPSPHSASATLIRALGHSGSSSSASAATGTSSGGGSGGGRGFRGGGACLPRRFSTPSSNSIWHTSSASQNAAKRL